MRDSIETQEVLLHREPDLDQTSSTEQHVSQTQGAHVNNPMPAIYQTEYARDPAGIWCQNDVELTSMRRDDVASTLIRRHFGTKCPLGSYESAEQLRTRQHSVTISKRIFLLDGHGQNIVRLLITRLIFPDVSI